MTDWTLVDLFCGAGGMSLGFSWEGVTPIFAVDHDKWALKTYQANFPRATIECHDLSSNDRDWLFPKADIVIGGPPCQGLSLIGRQPIDDPRNDLWRHYITALYEIRPIVFVMENVPRLLKTAHITELRRQVEDLYDVHEKVLNAADFGVPQLRRRAFVIGVQRHTGINAADLFPSGQYYSQDGSRQPMSPLDGSAADAWWTVEEAFSTYVLGPEGKDRGQAIPKEPSVKADESWKPDEPRSGRELHAARTASELSLRRYALIGVGQDRRNLPERDEYGPLIPDCWRGRSAGTDVMGRLWWDKPSVTIRTEFWKPEKGRFLHPDQHRALTHWEAARLQTFPDSFCFIGSKPVVGRQIGNAVPPRLAAAVARRICEILADHGIRPRSIEISTATASCCEYGREDLVDCACIPRNGLHAGQVEDTKPELIRVLARDDWRQPKARARLDLTPYLAIIDEVTSVGAGGHLVLAQGENRRAEKRRMSLAAKERGYELTWRKAEDRSLRFVLARLGEIRPGGPRKLRVSETAARTGGRSRQTSSRSRS